MSETPFRYIAISSQKGGVAKTTTCLSLGAALAEQGLQVLLVDLDPQAHLTQALGINAENLRRTVGDVLLFQSTLLEVSRESAVPGLDLVPADRGLILVEKMLHGAKSSDNLEQAGKKVPPEGRLQMALENSDINLNAGHYYDLVLLDCPPSFGPLTINALAAAQLVIIPVTCDFFAMQSLNGYLKLLDLVRRNINPHIVHRILVTLYDGRTRLSKLILEQYRQKFGALSPIPQMFDTVIPMDTKVRESSVFGRPVLQYATRARGAREYRMLAAELTGSAEILETTPPR
jgi:chromosome partitioning protein